jgi:hypothetical protein
LNFGSIFQAAELNCAPRARKRQLLHSVGLNALIPSQNGAWKRSTEIKGSSE